MSSSSSSSHDPWVDCFISLREGENDLEWLFFSGFALAKEYARREDEHPVIPAKNGAPDHSFIKHACANLSVKGTIYSYHVSPVHGKEEAVVSLQVSGDGADVPASLTSKGVEVKRTQTTKMSRLRGRSGDWCTVYALVSTKT